MSEKSGWTVDTLRDDLLRLMAETDRRYMELRNADQLAADRALESVQKATDKAESNDRLYRAQQNEWRGSLNDVISKSVLLDQYNTAHSALIEKINDQGRSFAEQLATLMPRAESKLQVDTLSTRVEATQKLIVQVQQTLVGFQSQLAGQNSGISESQNEADRSRRMIFAVLGAAIAIIVLMVSVFFGFRQQNPPPVQSTPQVTVAR